MSTHLLWMYSNLKKSKRAGWRSIWRTLSTLSTLIRWDFFCLLKGIAVCLEWKHHPHANSPLTHQHVSSGSNPCTYLHSSGGNRGSRGMWIRQLSFINVLNTLSQTFSCYDISTLCCCVVVWSDIFLLFFLMIVNSKWELVVTLYRFLVWVFCLRSLQRVYFKQRAWELVIPQTLLIWAPRPAALLFETHRILWASAW